MVRDDDFIRELLLDIEATPPLEVWSRQWPEPEEQANILGYHLWLLQDAGYIEAGHHSRFLSRGEVWHSVKLTWAGTNFLNTIRDPGVWTETKNRVASTVGTVSIAVLTEVATSVARRMLGLP